MRYMYIDFPAPVLDGADPCTVCAGDGITGEMYGHAGLNGITLVVDTLCPCCGGCGRAEHAECEPASHGITPAELTMAYLAGPLAADLLDGHPAPDDPDAAAFILSGSAAYLDAADEAAPWIGHPDDGAPCLSCEGRQWTAMQTLSGRAPDTRLLVFRVPCRCAGGRAREIDATVDQADPGSSG